MYYSLFHLQCVIFVENELSNDGSQENTGIFKFRISDFKFEIVQSESVPLWLP